MTAMGARVRVTDTVTVRPSQPPFDSDHVLSLSHLDNDPNLRTTIRYLRVYVSTSGSSTAARNPYHVIAGSLSRTVVDFYPLTGTLRRRPNGRLELLCAVGRGIRVVYATADCSLDSVGYLDDLSAEFVEDLVPDPDPEEALANPFVLQVTVFGCGGLCLGAAVYHALCDGMGATLFFSAMAGFARGLDMVPVHPVWDRTKLLGPRGVPRVVLPLDDVLYLDEEFWPYDEASRTGPVRKVCYHVKKEWVDRFRMLMLERSGSSFTTFEALGAFIWRAKVKSSGVRGTERVKFAYSINIRRLMNPPLPNGYWGNGCVPMYVPLAAKDLVEQPIWKTAEMIKASKANATDEYVRSFVDFQELNYANGITAGKGVSAFTDWRHLGHSDVDFGWGGPVTVLPLSRHLLGSTEPCFLLPLPAGKGGGEKKDGVQLVIVLEERAVDGFLEEMRRLGNLEFGSSSL